tara:strand:- start:50034 stop:50480 length:447 start_codon:yes stop_codon:yes gene_type:complete
MAKHKYPLDKSPFLQIEGKLKIYREDVQDLEGDLQIVKKKYYQSNDYVKFIIKDTVAITDYVKLGDTAKNLLYYIVHILEYNSPIFKLRVKDVSLLIDANPRTVFKAIKELVDTKYIARTTTKEIYWINHNRFYKGNYTFEIFAQKKQ